MKTIELNEREISVLKALKELCIEDDLLDLDSFDSISRSKKINDAWEALKVIERKEKQSTGEDKI